MAQAKRDQNGVKTLLATKNDTSIPPVLVYANPLNGALAVGDGTTGTDFGTPNARRDENRETVLMAVSSVDGVTPVAVYADNGGKLLIQSS